MKFSLLIGTLNRAKELEYCLEALLSQSYKDFEIIIIDQSDDEATKNLVENLHSNHIVYQHVSFRGLSKARNVALQTATGDYLCLIDDDAYYPEDYLLNLSEHYKKNKSVIISGYMWDAIEGKEFIDYSHLRDGKILSTRMIIRKCPSPAISFPRNVIEDIGMFDESFGVGARYGAAEETDLLLRADKAGYQTVFYRNIKLEHPHKMAKRISRGDTNVDKMYRYAIGIGAMYRKQISVHKNYKVFFPFGEQLARHLIKTLLRKEYASVMLRGFIRGFTQYKTV